MVLAPFALVAMGGHRSVALLAGMVLLDVGVYGLHISMSVIYSLAATRAPLQHDLSPSFFIAPRPVQHRQHGLRRRGFGRACLAGAACAAVLLMLWLGEQRFGRQALPSAGD